MFRTWNSPTRISERARVQFKVISHPSEKPKGKGTVVEPQVRPQLGEEKREGKEARATRRRKRRGGPPRNPSIFFYLLWFHQQQQVIGIQRSHEEWSGQRGRVLGGYPDIFLNPGTDGNRPPFIHCRIQIARGSQSWQLNLICSTPCQKRSRVLHVESWSRSPQRFLRPGEESQKKWTSSLCSFLRDEISGRDSNREGDSGKREAVVPFRRPFL